MSEPQRVEGVFERLSPRMQSALVARGFDEPTEPQRRAILPLADGRNALVTAPTGTGKTETAMLPVFDAVLRRGSRFGMSVLYITPLRALNRDMRDRLEWWGEELELEVDVRHGDTTRYRRTQQANDPPDVLVTTPETLQAMLTGEKLRTALSDVAHVVVDEVHELAASKRGAQLAVALERLVELAGGFQRIGLSATVGDPGEVGRFLTGDRGCEHVAVLAGSRLELTVTVPVITEEDQRLAGELATEPDVASQVRAVLEAVESHESTLIFVNTRQAAEALGSRFNTLDADIGVHHGSLSKAARVDVEDRFKAGELDGLLCTSSMELGIDVGRVDHVVQYGSPREVARLLQRVGRAGHRADRVSTGTVVGRNPDDAMESLVIARRALDDAVEPAAIHHGSLDVVANQVVGLVMDFGELSARRAYDVVTRAYPFRNLGESQFKDVVREVSQNRLVWLDEDEDQLSKRGGTWEYYYSNLSMIPDEETYAVQDMAGGGQIGTLDERFVKNVAEPGVTFIQRGDMWRIVEVDEEDGAVNATPVEDPGGEIPSWIGEEIPVPYAVAQHVGRLRAKAADQFAAGAGVSTVAEEFEASLPGDKRTLETALAPVAEHAASDHPVPTADRLVVEGERGGAVVNAALGHQVNETLGRLLSALLGQATGSSVGLDVDPYRIDLAVPPGVRPATVVDTLLDTEPDHLEAILELALKRAPALEFELSQVAATFGSLKRWRGSGEGVGGPRLRAILEDTPAFDEAIRSIFHDDLDVDRASALIAALRGDDVAIESIEGRTPLGKGGESSGRELLAADQADAGVIETVKERLQNDRVRLVCLHCREWTRRTKVKRVADQPKCPECSSTRVASLNPWADEVVQAVQSDDRDEDQDSMVRRAYKAANLVQSHGKQAVIALAARGVGPQNAARIIANLREDEDGFYRDILRREREYARTRSFWD